MPEEKFEIRGWKDVQITVDMPLSTIVDFANVLNQRLANIEDIIKTTLPSGEQISLTELYKRQTEAQYKASQEQKEPTKGE